ncbi:MAG: N-acetylmuramoyl-L-alanine amidase [Lachnospiraceae bacterium]|nr:N-acetylmuramoyl-L-alanine amidase [Lachnospiraceae bacterium]
MKVSDDIRFIKNSIRVAVVGLLMTLLVCVRAQAAVICLDPGHGGIGTSGAGAYYPPYMEKALNFALATQVKSELEQAGHTVYMTRSGDISIDLAQRAAYASSVGADFLISLHFNSSGAHDKYGSEVWTSLYGGHRSNGYALGNSVLSQLTALGFVNKGVKTKLGNSGDYYGIIRHGVSFGISTVIIEHCFMDNPIDRALMESKGLNALAHADAVGIKNYLDSVGGSVPKAGPVMFVEGSTAAGGTGVATTLAAASTAAAASNPYSTKYGFAKDALGNVTYVDAGGNRATYTAAEWNRLLANWSYTGDAEYFLKQLPVGDLNRLLGK